MAIDQKYGKVTLECGAIGKDEPVVVFRAKDSLLPALLSYYRMLCLNAGSSDQHLLSITDAQREVISWQEQNESQVPT